MARSSANRNNVPPLQFPPAQSPPELDPGFVPFWLQPQGIDYQNRLSRIDPNSTPFSSNFRLDRGKLRQRPGTSQLGSVGSAVSVLQAQDFVLSSGTRYTIRFRTTDVQYFDATSQTWVSFSGPTLSGTLSNSFSTTSWDDKCVFTNGVDGLFELDFTTRAYTKIAGGYAGKHVTTFDGRIVICAVMDGGYKGYRIRWSAKYSDTDYTGIGSGYEDLLSTPGGVVDEALGVYPITDETALLVRGNSIWLMVVTGNASAPFRFSRIQDKIPCKSRRTIVSVPGGVVFMGEEDVYFVTPTGITTIGDRIRNRLINAMLSSEYAWADYDSRRAEYVVAVREGSAAINLNVAYRYSFFDKGWSREEYPFETRSLSFSRYTHGTITIDQLTGTIDQLTGTIDDLGVTSRDSGMLFVVHGAGGQDYVLREDSTTYKDYDASGTVQTDTTAEIRTGLLSVGDLLGETELSEIQLEYEASSPCTLNFDYSVDGGNSWSSYSSVAIQATTRPTLLSCTKVLTGYGLQVRIVPQQLAGVIILGLYLKLMKGGQVHA